MGFAIRPTAYTPHSREWAHRVSRPAKVKSTGASLRGQPVPFHWGSRPRRWPRTPGRVGELAVWSEVCCPSRAETEEPGQGAWRAGGTPLGA